MSGNALITRWFNIIRSSLGGGRSATTMPSSPGGSTSSDPAWGGEVGHYNALITRWFNIIRSSLGGEVGHYNALITRMEAPLLFILSTRGLKTAR